MHHPISMYWWLNSFVSETSWGLCLGSEVCIRTLRTVCNPTQCIWSRMWLIVRIMNTMSNIKPVGKIMLAFGDHRRHGDLNLYQVLVFMVTLCDGNKYITCNCSLKHFYQTFLMLQGTQWNLTNTQNIFSSLVTFSNNKTDLWRHKFYTVCD
jgi:hypothetical protein